MSTHDRWLSAPYDDVPQDLIDAEVEAIYADQGRYVEAMIIDDDAPVHLAELRIVLADVVGILGSLSMGCDLSDLLKDGNRAIAFRALIRASDSAWSMAQERVAEAAADAVSIA